MPKVTQTPGTMLKTLLSKRGLSVGALSKGIHTSDALLYLIAQDKTRITVPVAFRLSKFFNTTLEYWLTAQMKFDIAKAVKNKAFQKDLQKISPIKKSKQ